MSEALKNRKTVWKTFWLWQYEEEEAWLNQMAAEGWVLEEVHFFRYGFTRCQPGEYTLRLEMLSGSPKKEENQEYIWFVQGTGAEYIGKLKHWIYFRKKTGEGPFDLFSDLDSRLNHVERVLWLAATLLLVIFFGTMNMITQVISLRDGQVYNGSGFLLILYIFMLLWMGRGTRKLWTLRKKLKEERRLRE